MNTLELLQERILQLREKRGIGKAQPVRSGSSDKRMRLLTCLSLPFSPCSPAGATDRRAACSADRHDDDACFYPAR